MSNLLLDERPIMVLPKLACEIGLNEAIILQQIHYWLQKSKNIEAGHKWIYNTYNAWQKQFPFWSIPTIRRTITSLEKQGMLVTGNFNKAGFDKTKWYRIDYQKIESMSRRCDQNDQTMRSIWTDGADQNDQTNTNRLPENTSETTTNISSGKPNDHLSESFESIWKEYPNKAGKKEAFRHYKKWRKESKEHTDEYLMKKLAAYKQDLATNQWKKPMNGSTWFNGRFDDEYSTPNRQPTNPYDRYYE